MRWRAMTTADLDGVVEVARVAFPNHPEERGCFENRLDLYPRGCRVLETDEGSVAGYCVAYPWISGTAPPLNSRYGALPAQADTLYLHDLALARGARGGGRATAAVQQVVELAEVENWPTISLVAVNDEAAFWGRFGFEVSEPEGMAAKLASYGPDARYMVRTV